MRLNRFQVSAIGIIVAVLLFGIVVGSPTGEPGEATHEPAPGGAAAASLTTPENASATTPDRSLAVDLNESHRNPATKPTAQEATPAGETVAFVVEATNKTAINTTHLRHLGAEVGSRHARYLEITASRSVKEKIETLPWVADTRPIITPERNAYSEGVGTMDANSLHELNVTGEGAKVGIITLGVDPHSTEYADQIVAAKSFHPSGINGSDPTHGTGVTEVVADTAPGADIYLTTFETSLDFANAAEWLAEQDVDVIVTSVAFLLRRDTGESFVSQVATNTTSNGIFWAASAGNGGNNHWQGSFADGDDDGWHNFAAEDEANYLNDGRMLPGGLSVQLRLKWDDYPETTDDYTLYLFNSNREVVDYSTRLSDGNAPREILTTTLPADDYYYFAIAGEPSTHTVEVFGSDSTYTFENNVKRGSIIAPSVAPGVTAVGAYHVDTGGLALYSAAGETTDGRRGLDILAPSKVTTEVYDPFTGTSAAAPHIGGAAALLGSLNDSATAAQIETALLRSARDVNASGPDVYTGYGKANVTAAAERLDPSVQLSIATNRSHGFVGDRIGYTVTRTDTGEPISSYVTVGNQTFETGPDGNVVLVASSPGNYTHTANTTKNPPTADFTADSTTVHIEPSNLNGSASFPDRLVRNGSETVTVESANYTLTNGTAGDYVVVVYLEKDGNLTGPVGYSATLSGYANTIQIDLNGSVARGDALDAITSNVTLHARLHESSSTGPAGDPLTINGSTVGDSARVVVLETAKPVTLDVELTPPTVTANESSNVTATVTDDVTGGPVEGVTVDIPDLQLTGTTDASGTVTFEVDASATGSYPVNATADGYEDSNTTLTVENATSVPDEAVYEPGSTAAEYDGDGDGRIDIGELGSAAEAFSAGTLGVSELGNVAEAFAAS